ncbi:MAG: hypothetical protein ACK5R0_12350 [Bacteroidota bacterium]
MYRSYSIAFLILSFTPSYSQTKVETLINTQQMRPDILYWDFVTIETIYHSEDSLGRYWNIIHRSIAPERETDGYDYYKMDSQTLRPLVSEMNHPGFIHYLIRFEKQQAAIQFKDSKDSVGYYLPLPSFVTPEGQVHLPFGAVCPFLLVLNWNTMNLTDGQERTREKEFWYEKNFV